jgi:hypothetical protein
MGQERSIDVQEEERALCVVGHGRTVSALCQGERPLK